MIWIDTHTHLYSEEFEADRDEMVARAIAAGVDQLLLPNIDESSIEGMLALEARYPGRLVNLGSTFTGTNPCYPSNTRPSRSNCCWQGSTSCRYLFTAGKPHGNVSTK
jgi:Tat protein secretion system quality control protein TatD with DNase activity